jgi:hypothetical protein
VKLRGELVGRDDNVGKECRGFDTMMKGVVSSRHFHRIERAMEVWHPRRHRG